MKSQASRNRGDGMTSKGGGSGNPRSFHEESYPRQQGSNGKAIK